MSVVLTRDETRCDGHGHQLLEEQLARVRYHDLRDGRALARVLAALERLVLQVGDGDQTALLAHVNSVRVRLVHETFLKERRGTVTHDTIAFHLTETQTTISGSTLHRLTRENLHRTATARVNLVINHVLQALVIRRTDENLPKSRSTQRGEDPAEWFRGMIA